MISKVELRNPTPEDRQHLLELAAIRQRTRALEESIRRANQNGAPAQQDGSQHQRDGAEIAPHTANA